jgi:hypothetical protein
LKARSETARRDPTRRNRGTHIGCASRMADRLSGHDTRGKRRDSTFGQEDEPRP